MGDKKYAVTANPGQFVVIPDSGVIGDKIYYFDRLDVYRLNVSTYNEWKKLPRLEIGFNEE